MATASDTKIVPKQGAFDINTDISSGLSLRVQGGTILHPSLGYQNVQNNTLTLDASATNYVEMSDPGVISSNTTSFTAGYTSLYIVTTGTATVTGIADARSRSASAAAVDGSEAALLANVNVIGGLPVVHRIDLAAGALADTDVVLTHKTRVIDAFLILRGAGVALTTLQVKNTATAITDAMDASGSDKALVRAATIDDAAYEVAAGGTLRVTSATGASQPAATVYVVGVRVA